MKISYKGTVVDKDILGKNIRAQRKKLGKKQKELAEELGVAANTVNYYEKGRAFPSLDILMKMTYILNTNMESLLGAPVTGVVFNTLEEELIQSCMDHIAKINKEIKQEEIFDLGSDHTDTSHQENMKRLERYKYLFMSIVKELKGGI